MADKRIPVFDENLGRTSGNAAGRASGLATGLKQANSNQLPVASTLKANVSRLQGVPSTQPSQTTTASQSKSNLYDQPVEHFPVAPTATTEPEEAAVPVTAAIDSAYDSLQEMMIGPSNGNEGTPPRQMASSQHVRRALAHQAVADGDFSVQVSNARGEVSFSAYPAPGHDDSLWGGLELAEEHAEDRPAAAADDVASS